jgi:putative (di)nucleoside polyphosphate hydrolase
MPQGGIDEGEDAAQAALRELYEETGMRSVELIAESPHWYTYDLPPELALKAWGGRYRGQKQKWFALRFVGQDDEIAVTRPPGQQIEFDAWRWADIGELIGLTVPFKRASISRSCGILLAWRSRKADLRRNRSCELLHIADGFS